MNLPNNSVPVQPNASYTETDMQIASDVMYSLSLEGAGSSERNEFKMLIKSKTFPILQNENSCLHYSH